MLSLLLKCLAGVLAVLLIAVLARSRNYFVAGLVPLFPTFALIAHWTVGMEGTPAQLRATAAFGLWSLVPYAVYLGAVWALCTRLSLVPTLAVATIAWGASAALVVMIWLRVNPPA